MQEKTVMKLKIPITGYIFRDIVNVIKLLSYMVQKQNTFYTCIAYVKKSEKGKIYHFLLHEKYMSIDKAEAVKKMDKIGKRVHRNT